MIKPCDLDGEIFRKKIFSFFYVDKGVFLSCEKQTRKKKKKEFSFISSQKRKKKKEEGRFEGKSIPFLP